MRERDLDPSEYDEIPGESEQLDQLQPDDSLDDRGVDDVLDEGLTTPERWSTLERNGDHETLDERLAEEQPDDDAAEDGQSDDFIDDGEVGDERAGRLMDPNEGIGEDDESELYGTDVGIDGAAASAEEAAVHVVDDDDR